MAKDIIVPHEDKALYKNFHFASAARANGLVLCSGQIGTQAGGGVPESAEDEFRNAWRSVGKVLAAGGLGFGDIVEINSFHMGLQNNLGTFMKVKDEFVKEPYPAWTAIGVSELAVPGARVEIKVVAADYLTDCSAKKHVMASDHPVSG